MKSVLTITTLLNLAFVVLAVPPFDPAGAKNVGNGKGGQFITGQCLSDADCASGCCANPTGICSGPGAQFQAGKTGCGFGSGGDSIVAAQQPATAATTAASAVASPAGQAAAGTNSKGGPPFDPAGVKNVGNGKGGQFITGQCLSNADCGSGCCAGPSGICSGPGAQFQAGKTGCGFPSAVTASSAGSDTSSSAEKPTAVAAAAGTNSKGGPPFDPAGVKNVGNGVGGQFITGQCLSNADCGSGCCAGPSGICSGPGAQFQAGKTGCGFSSSAAAAGAGAGTDTAAAAVQSPAAVASTNSKGGPPFDPAGEKNVGNGKAGQFIGGQCLSSADCASGCCAGPSGICSGPGASTQAGKTGCGFVSKRRLVRM